MAETSVAIEDPMCVCGDRRSVHRRVGRASCKAPDCSCDQFETSDDREEQKRVLTVVAEVCTDQADKARAELAGLTGEPAEQPAPCPFCRRWRELTGVPEPVVLGSYDAWLCQSCGARYGQRYTDHPCGPLVPVTVTITRRETA